MHIIDDSGGLFSFFDSGKAEADQCSREVTAPITFAALNKRETAVENEQENRYLAYFCDVLRTWLNKNIISV